jgi:hypothetical protein
MKKKYKIILITLGGIILLCASFVSGFYFSLFNYFPSYALEMQISTMSNQILIEQIDKKEIQDAHKLLRLRLNGNILALDTLIEESNEEEKDKDKMKHLLKRISKHREAFPEHYSPITVEGYELEEANKQIVEILNKYKS